MALTTQENSLKEISNENGKRKKLFCEEIDPRRENVAGPSMVVNGEVLQGHDKHMNPIKFPGRLCIPYEPEDDGKQQKDKDERKRKQCDQMEKAKKNLNHRIL